MTLQDLADTLARAGFEGIEIVPPLVYARADGPSAPEFTAALSGDVILTRRFDTRAPDAALSDWKITMRGQLAIVNGETHLTLATPPEALPQALHIWRDLMQAATKAAIAWRRGQRPLHGM